MTESRTASAPETLPLDTALELLCARRRRLAVGMLAEHDRRLTLNDLTKRIVAREREEEITDVPPAVLADVHHSLVHIHAPKLADAGVVTYDHDRQTVEPAAQLERVERYLRAIEAVDRTRRATGTR